MGAREEQPEERDLGGGTHGGQDIMHPSPNGDPHGPGVRAHRGDALSHRRRDRPVDPRGHDDERARVRARRRLHRPGVLRRRGGEGARLPEPAGAAHLPRHADLHPRPLERHVQRARLDAARPPARAEGPPRRRRGDPLPRRHLRRRHAHRHLEAREPRGEGEQVPRQDARDDERRPYTNQDGKLVAVQRRQAILY